MFTGKITFFNLLALTCSTIFVAAGLMLSITLKLAQIEAMFWGFSFLAILAWIAAIDLLRGEDHG